MKSLKVLTAMLLSVTLIFSSCGSWNNTQKGAAIGVGGGAAVGAGVGAIAGNTALGTINSQKRFWLSFQKESGCNQPFQCCPCDQ